MNPIRRKFLRDTASADWSNGQRRRYARQFEASVEHLGDRWLLAQPQPRRSAHVPAPRRPQSPFVTRSGRRLN